VTETSITAAAAALLGALVLWAMRAARSAVQRGEVTIGYRDLRTEIDTLNRELAEVRSERDELRGRAEACQAHAERALEQLLRRQGRLRQEKTDDP